MKNNIINKGFLEAYRKYYFGEAEKILSDQEIIDHLEWVHEMNENPKKPTLQMFLRKGCCLDCRILVRGISIKNFQCADGFFDTGRCSDCQFEEDYF